jgi:hypothetical protein
MFGYVTADKPNMLMKDYSTYRAYYCGLCKALGKEFSQATRFSVNYDIAFLTLIAHNYRKITPVFKEGRCPAHPIGKKIPLVQADEAQNTVAGINVILGYYKAEDDVKDGGFIGYFARAFLKGKMKKASKRLPGLAKKIEENYNRLREYEKDKEKNVDLPAECFAQIMKDVGEAAAGKTDKPLEDLCYNLGRWIYFVDAYDDLKEDAAAGRYNPFLPEGELTEERESEIFEKASFNIRFSAAEIRKAYDAMDVSVSEGPLSNIIYCGIPARTEEIINNRGEKCRKTRSRS